MADYKRFMSASVYSLAHEHTHIRTRTYVRHGDAIGKIKSPIAVAEDSRIGARAKRYRERIDAHTTDW